MVLVAVAVAIILASLAAYGLALQMQTEHRAARARADQLQADAAASAGRELLARLMELSREQREELGGLYDNAELFQDVRLFDDAAGPSATGVAAALARPDAYRFSILTPAGVSSDVRTRSSTARSRSRSLPQSAEGGLAGEGLFGSPRYGVANESAKMNLCQLAQWDAHQPGLGRFALLQIPGFTDEIADAVLDWIDADDVQREFGAESDYYSTLPTPYRAANGPIASLSSLLLVRGVTADLLWGEMASVLTPPGRFGPTDPKDRPPSPNSPFRPSAWAEYLTVCSGERNVALDGQPRIFLNAADLVDLHQQVAGRLGFAWANFIVLMRQSGPASPNSEPLDAAQVVVDLNAPATFHIDSPWSLLGAHAKTTDPATGEATSVPSPLALDAQVALQWPMIVDQLTVDSAIVISGRVNLSEAPAEVIQGIPGVDAVIARRVLDMRNDLAKSPESIGLGSTMLLSRLVAEGAIDLERSKLIGRSITDGGDVSSAFVLGYKDERRPFSLWSVVMDGSKAPARQIGFLDFRDTPPDGVEMLIGEDPHGQLPATTSGGSPSSLGRGAPRVQP